MQKMIVIEKHIEHPSSEFQKELFDLSSDSISRQDFPKKASNFLVQCYIKTSNIIRCSKNSAPFICFNTFAWGRFFATLINKIPFEL